MKKLITTVLIAVSLLITAQAALIDLGLTTGSPADVTTEMGRLNTQIQLYNSIYSPALTYAGATMGWTGTQTPGDGVQKSVILNLDGFNGYLMFKWGNKDQFYYLNDNTPFGTPTVSSVSYLGSGEYQFFSTVLNSSGQSYLGLSHHTEFTAVPEPATFLTGAMMLLPVGASLLFRGHKRVFRIGK